LTFRTLIWKFKERPKVTIRTIRRMAKQKEPISMMTAQDYPSGLMVDRAGIDTCLVGDSLAMVTLGHDTTNPVTVNVSSVSRYTETLVQWLLTLSIGNDTSL
jgi:ketopantoate hydroxymethyltransferase